jgi:hypothetical protein
MIDLYWLPLGAGGHFVRLNGRVYEAGAARLQRRSPCDLYHSALVVRVPEGRFVIEQAPAGPGGGAERGVVSEGSGRQPLGRTLPPLPLRASPLAGRGDPRRRRGRREPEAPDGRRRDRAAAPRSRPVGANPGVGPRRARRGREVELQLLDLVADHVLRACPSSRSTRPPADAPPAGRPGSSSRAAAERGRWSHHPPPRLLPQSSGHREAE